MKTFASVVKTWPDCVQAPPIPVEQPELEPQPEPIVEAPVLNTSLRVFNLSDEATEHDLRALFKTFGHIKRIKIVRDQFTDRSRGFGFVTFATHEQARSALRMNGRPYGYQILQVDWSNPRKPKN